MTNRHLVLTLNVSAFDRQCEAAAREEMAFAVARGMKGVYQHCRKHHLHRYLAEFDFRYTNRSALGIDDQARAVKALQGVVGKRLYYRQPT